MTLTEQEVVGLIREIYKTYPSGGALHIVLDDGNTEDEFIRWCIENALKYVEEKDQWMFVRCAELMLTMPEHKRYRAIVTAFKDDGEYWFRQEVRE